VMMNDEMPAAKHQNRKDFSMLSPHHTLPYVIRPAVEKINTLPYGAAR
jgi:hypothetical protein